MFSFDTVKNFDDHIASSIPAYDNLFDTVVNLSDFFLVPNTNFIDIGCSTGKLLETIHHDGLKTGIDKSRNLLPRLNSLTVDYFSYDITEFYGFQDCSLVTSLFTLQFIDRNLRQDLLKRIYDGLRPDGAFIWAEKVYAESGKIQEMLTSALHQHKKQFFDASEILDKDADLRRLMRPNTSAKNQQMAEEAGFTNGELIWKSLNFEAWLYIK